MIEFLIGMVRGLYDMVMDRHSRRRDQVFAVLAFIFIVSFAFLLVEHEVFPHTPHWVKVVIFGVMVISGSGCLLMLMVGLLAATSRTVVVVSLYDFEEMSQLITSLQEVMRRRFAPRVVTVMGNNDRTRLRQRLCGVIGQDHPRPDLAAVVGVGTEAWGLVTELLVTDGRTSPVPIFGAAVETKSNPDGRAGVSDPMTVSDVLDYYRILGTVAAWALDMRPPKQRNVTNPPLVRIGLPYSDEDPGNRLLGEALARFEREHKAREQVHFERIPTLPIESLLRVVADHLDPDSPFRINALLIPTDNRVQTKLSEIIAAADDAGVPVVGASERAVECGASFSIAYDYAAIGCQAGEMVLLHLRKQSVFGRLLNRKYVSPAPLRPMLFYKHVEPKLVQRIRKAIKSEYGEAPMLEREVVTRDNVSAGLPPSHLESFDRRFGKSLRGYKRSFAILLADQLRLFDSILRVGPEAKIKRIQTDLAQRGWSVAQGKLEILLGALVGLRLLSYRNDAYYLSGDASRFLCTTTSGQPNPRYIGGLINYHRQRIGLWTDLAAVLQSSGGGSRVKQLDGLDVARTYNETMRDINAEIARSLAQLVKERYYDRSGCQILDVGCGSGIMAETIRSVVGGTTAVLVDYDEVKQAWCERRKGGVDTGVEFWSGDFLDYATDRRYDLVILSFICHHYDDRRCERIMARCLDLLAPDGAVLFHEFKVDKETCSPVAQYLFHLSLLVYNDDAPKIRSQADFEQLWRRASGPDRHVRFEPVPLEAQGAYPSFAQWITFG